MKKISDSEICVVCGIFTKSFLCANHRGRYIIYPDHNFVALKPRRKISKAQTGVYKQVRETYKSPTFQEIIFPFLMFYRFDIGVPEHKLIIEYDSQLHFKYIKHFHKSRANFKRRQKLDDVKENIVKEQGWKVIRINYKDKPKDVVKKLKVNLLKLKK